MSFLTNPMTSHSSLIHVWSLDRKVLENNPPIGRFDRWNSYSISKPGLFTNWMGIPTVKSSDRWIIFQYFSVQRSNMYERWMRSHWISQRAHVSGAVEVNVTFYLVETFISVNIQWQVATRTVEVEIGAISHKLSMEYIIQGPIVYILSNSGVWWWVSRWYSLL